MKKTVLGLCMALLLQVTSLATAADEAEPLRRLLEGLPGLVNKDRVTPTPVEHVMYPLVRSSTFGNVELDQTTSEIVFTARTPRKVRPRLYRNDNWERMGFSIVHSEKRYPYQSGVIYKLILTQQERFTILYFREYEGRVSVERLF